MKQAVRQIAVFAAIMIILLLIGRVTLFRTYTIRFQTTEQIRAGLETGSIKASVRQPEAAHLGPVRLYEGYAAIQVHPDQPGEAEIDLIIEENGILYPIEIKKNETAKADQASAFPVLDNIEEKRRGPGAIICTCPTVGLLRDNLFAVPVHYI